ncbi:MAG: hypothetical protein BGP25_05600 [Lysobacterales bacterium 63-13]|nr:MAG: hypothetical protein BGP25_05600 [Xanthomonadales bacterium 63-13]
MIEQLGLLIGAIATGNPDRIKSEVNASKDLIAQDEASLPESHGEDLETYYIHLDTCVRASSSYAAAKTAVARIVAAGNVAPLIVTDPSDVSSVEVDLALPEDNGGVSSVSMPTIVRTGPNVFVTAGVEPFGHGNRYDFYLGVGNCDLHVVRQSDATFVKAYPTKDNGVGTPLTQLSVDNVDVE